MTSEPVRDRLTDHLLTPDNAALIVIDYQPAQVNHIGSRNRQELIDNVVRVARTAVAFGLPIVLSTGNVKTGVNQPTIPELTDAFGSIEALDRTTVNAWEDIDFRRAVEATGRRKLIKCALWTEVCLAFPALDALRDGYDVNLVVGAVGGTSIEAHRAGLDRVRQAGGKSTSWAQLMCELQRAWARTATVQPFREILFGRSSANSAKAA
jgi:nicotinamidase-related amidase